MGLLGSGPDTGPCHFDQGGVEVGNNGTKCPNCGTYIHYDCLKSHGLVAEDSNLIRSNNIKIKCPNCGHVGKYSG
jgi:predicted RNA-binding Zn-ribbon protein involved in translation (DUF1610 family)